MCTAVVGAVDKGKKPPKKSVLCFFLFLFFIFVVFYRCARLAG